VGEPERDALVGHLVGGRYRIVDVIGEGAMASIYRAQCDDPARVVAVKLIHPEMIKNETALARFHREATAAGRLKHPGCVEMLDWGVEGQRPYIVMELVPGEDLYRLLGRERRIAQERAIAIAIKLCDVLEAAHELGIIHRDLKPENIMLMPPDARTGQQHIKVLDFGIAKLVMPDHSDTWSDATSPRALTRVGSAIGTPTHMSPEQAKGQPIDGRADLYAVGVLLYEMVTGHLPFEGKDPIRVAVAQVKEPPRPPSDHYAEIDSSLEHTILVCLAKAPDARWQTAAELRERLTKVLEALASEFDDDSHTELLTRPMSREVQERVSRMMEQSGLTRKPSVDELNVSVGESLRDKSPRSTGTGATRIVAGQIVDEASGDSVTIEDRRALTESQDSEVSTLPQQTLPATLRDQLGDVTLQSPKVKRPAPEAPPPDADEAIVEGEDGEADTVQDGVRPPAAVLALDNSPPTRPAVDVDDEPSTRRGDDESPLTAGRRARKGKRVRTKLGLGKAGVPGLVPPRAGGPPRPGGVRRSEAPRPGASTPPAPPTVPVAKRPPQNDDDLPTGQQAPPARPLPNDGDDQIPTATMERPAVGADALPEWARSALAKHAVDEQRARDEGVLPDDEPETMTATARAQPTSLPLPLKHGEADDVEEAATLAEAPRAKSPRVDHAQEPPTRQVARDQLGVSIPDEDEDDEELKPTRVAASKSAMAARQRLDALDRQHPSMADDEDGGTVQMLAPDESELPMRPIAPTLDMDASELPRALREVPNTQPFDAVDEPASEAWPMAAQPMRADELDELLRQMPRGDRSWMWALVALVALGVALVALYLILTGWAGF
jgi:serine/threonine-protein kinase